MRGMEREWKALSHMEHRVREKEKGENGCTGKVLKGIVFESLLDFHSYGNDAILNARF